MLYYLTQLMLLNLFKIYGHKTISMRKANFIVVNLNILPLPQIVHVIRFLYGDFRYCNSSLCHNFRSLTSKLYCFIKYVKINIKASIFSLNVFIKMLKVLFKCL